MDLVHLDKFIQKNIYLNVFRDLNYSASEHTQRLCLFILRVKQTQPTYNLDLEVSIYNIQLEKVYLYLLILS